MFVLPVALANHMQAEFYVRQNIEFEVIYEGDHRMHDHSWEPVVTQGVLLFASMTWGIHEMMILSHAQPFLKETVTSFGLSIVDDDDADNRPRTLHIRDKFRALGRLVLATLNKPG